MESDAAIRSITVRARCVSSARLLSRVGALSVVVVVWIPILPRRILSYLYMCASGLQTEWTHWGVSAVVD